MSSRKIEVESLTNLTINSLVRLATVVYVFVQYPHKKITVTKSCGADREVTENCDGNDPVVRNDCLVKGGEEGEADVYCL
jgi:hypothetical protein